MRTTVFTNKVNHRAAEWVRESAFVKWKPNMTAWGRKDWE